MRWSKLKQRIEANFAPSVKGRVALFQTRYHNAHDDFGETWMTVDGERAFSWGDLSSDRAHYTADAIALPPAARETATRDEWIAAQETVSASLEAGGVLNTWGFFDVLLQALSLSIDLMLGHRNPIIRGLAILDRRLGKRRLRTLDIANEHPFVRSMFELRCQSEGIDVSGSGNS